MQRPSIQTKIISARSITPGMSINTHQDVFWEVVDVRPSGVYVDLVLVQLAHGRIIRFDAYQQVRVLAIDPGD